LRIKWPLGVLKHLTSSAIFTTGGDEKEKNLRIKWPLGVLKQTRYGEGENRKPRNLVVVDRNRIV